jgi:chromosome segregation ATPase
MKDKNKISTPKSIDNSKILEEAVKKLEILEQKQKRSEMTVKQKERYDNTLKSMEAQLKRRVQLDRLISLGINENTISQIELFIRNISNVNLESLKKLGNISKSNKDVQTEADDIDKIKNGLQELEKENVELNEKKQKYKKEVDSIKAELKEYKENNEKLLKENKHLNYNLEELNNEKLSLEIKVKDINREKESLLEQIKKMEKINSDYNDLKKIMEEKIQNDREKVELEDRSRNNLIELFRGNVKVIIYLKQFHHITKYLSPTDILNLKLTNSAIRDEIDSNIDCVKGYYNQICKEQYSKIKELSNLDVKKEYCINETEIESLMTE